MKQHDVFGELEMVKICRNMRGEWYRISLVSWGWKVGAVGLYSMLSAGQTGWPLTGCKQNASCSLHGMSSTFPPKLEQAFYLISYFLWKSNLEETFTNLCWRIFLLFKRIWTIIGPLRAFIVILFLVHFISIKMR